MLVVNADAAKANSGGHESNKEDGCNYGGGGYGGDEGMHTLSYYQWVTADDLAC